eukprot:4597546-Amphidinium_carterae.2
MEQKNLGTMISDLQEKRVRLDIADIRQNVDEGKGGMSWIQTACMLTDYLTTYVANRQFLFLFLEFNIMVVDSEELIQMQPASSA